MITDLNSILIFKTNIKTQRAKKRILDLLVAFAAIEQATVDLADKDCVLRIVSGSLSAEQIISIIIEAGFECSELE